MWARIRRWRWGGAIALLLAMGIAYSFWPERVPVDIARVDRGEMAIGVTDDGVTRVRDLFTVSAPVSGYVTRIELDPGDRVVAGSTVIARMRRCLLLRSIPVPAPNWKTPCAPRRRARRLPRPR